MEFHILTHAHTESDIGKIDKKILHSHHMVSPNYTMNTAVGACIVSRLRGSFKRPWYALDKSLCILFFSLSFHFPIFIFTLNYTIFGMSRRHNTFDQILKSDFICSWMYSRIVLILLFLLLPWPILVPFYFFVEHNSDWLSHNTIRMCEWVYKYIGIS